MSKISLYVSNGHMRSFFRCFGFNNTCLLIKTFSGQRLPIYILTQKLKLELDYKVLAITPETHHLLIPRRGMLNSALNLSNAKSLYLKGNDFNLIKSKTGVIESDLIATINELSLLEVNL